MPRTASTPNKDFKESESHIFGTIVWATLGAVNSEGESLLAPNHALCLRAPEPRAQLLLWPHMGPPLSCCLQREVAKQIIQRTAGQMYHDKLPKNASAEDVAARVKARVEIDN